MPRPFKIPIGRTAFKFLVAPGICIALLALFLNGTDYFLSGLIGFITSPIFYILWKRKYGGLSSIDPETYPLNPRTKLAKGDLHRISIIFGLLGVLGIIAAFLFLPWFEGSWGMEYYGDLYGGNNTFHNLLLAIKVLSIAYCIIAVTVKMIGNKIDADR